MTVQQLIESQLADAWALFLDQIARAEMHDALAEAYALRIARLQAQLQNPTTPVYASTDAPDEDGVMIVGERTIQ